MLLVPVNTIGLLDFEVLLLGVGL